MCFYKSMQHKPNPLKPEHEYVDKLLQAEIAFYPASQK